MISGPDSLELGVNLSRPADLDSVRAKRVKPTHLDPLQNAKSSERGFICKGVSSVAGRDG